MEEISEHVPSGPSLEDVQTPSGSGVSVSRRRSAYGPGSFVATESSYPGTKKHSSPLYVLSKSKKGIFQVKWVVLGNANIRYFHTEESMAEPKELILLRDVLSINKREELQDEQMMYIFDIAFSTQQHKNKLVLRSFAAITPNVRDTWVDKITQSLSHKLDSFSMENCTKLGWAYLKVSLYSSCCLFQPALN